MNGTDSSEQLSQSLFLMVIGGAVAFLAGTGLLLALMH
jgi:hypothetical protein